MDTRQAFSLKTADLLWIAVCLLVLIACLYYPFVGASPELGFTLSPADGKVASAYPCPDPGECLRIGDQLISIGKIRYEDFARDRTIEFLDAFKATGKARVRILRDNRILSFEVRLKPTEEGGLKQVHSFVLLPLTFWIMGTIAVIFLRPRDERWLVLVLFSYVSAIWTATGPGSSSHVAGSAIVFHVFIWLFLPLSVHLHTILPNSLFNPRFRWTLLTALYGFSLVLIVLDSLYLLNGIKYSYLWCTVIGVGLSVLLLLSRLFLPLEPAAKVAVRIMLYGIVLGMGPFILFNGVVILFFLYTRFKYWELRSLYPFMTAISLISMPILPMSYIYAIYKHHLGALEFRANRLLGVYSFLAISISCYVIVIFFLSSQWASTQEGFLAFVLIVSLVFVSSVPLLRSRFQAMVDRHVFGIKHSAEDVIGLVSERIPTAFDRTVLAGLVADEILPTLLIRQSALYLFQEPGKETLYEQALPAGEREPTVGELEALLAKSGRYLTPQAGGAPRSWVRLVIPLAIQARTIGVWLIGRRDPDDYFPASDIHLLSTVANQIAPMVENIRLYERAQQEIAQRKAAEEEIRRSEERFRTLFEATLEGIAIVRNGVVLEVNQALLAIFGYSPGELIGHRLADLVSDGAAALSAVPRESSGIKSDGSRVDIEVAGKKYVFQGEDVIVVAIRDIAQRKRSEAETKMLQRQLLLSQKMEAIGRLSAGVAHDFNNCLLAIFGYSDLLLDSYREDPFLARNLSGIKEAGQKAAALTKQLLAFARRQPLETRVLSLNEIVSGLEKMMQRLLGEDITLASELNPDVGKVKVDPGQIEQVVVNLAVNARHAMPTGGRITLRTQPLEVARGASPPHADLPPGSYVLLTVADTGTGMDAETQARIFEPFFTTKEEGTGLGLSTAYGIVRQSGGYIFVDSAPGRGACFSLYLPVTRERETQAFGVASGLSDTGSETILLVEDEDEVRTVLLQILGSKGYRVLAASSGDEALAIAARHQGDLHLLLTDVTMPRMKGTQLADQLLDRRPDTRIVYMSGYNEEPLSESGRICLQKPFTPQVLTQTVRAILDAPEAEPIRKVAQG
jgi:PAS domain S-box-containing protein